MDNVIVIEYMQRKYPNKQYSINKGNNCIWVMMGIINMYFIIKDNKIIRIDID